MSRVLVLLLVGLSPVLAQARYQVSTAAPLLTAPYEETFQYRLRVAPAPAPLDLGSLRPARPSVGRELLYAALRVAVEASVQGLTRSIRP